jgi:hypothetical protein
MYSMELTPEQLARVQYLLDNRWHPRASCSRHGYWTKFDRVTGECAPEELHAFADQWNWDQRESPEDPEVDVRALLSAIMFMAVASQKEG